MVTRMPRAAAFAAAVAVAVLAAACSGEGSATTADRAAPATSAAPSTTTTTAPPTTTTTIPPCPAPRGVDGDVDVFRSAPGGACRPAGELVAYRCANRSVPAIVTGLGGDQPVDHLGGRFASTVPALPADATAIGVREDGADPGLYAERVRAVMAELAGVDLVLWLTIREARPYYATTNATLHQVLAGYPNAVVADWNATAPPGATYADGLHLRAEGAAAMAALARDAVFAWYASTVDRGPDACRPQLDAAVAGGR